MDSAFLSRLLGYTSALGIASFSDSQEEQSCVSRRPPPRRVPSTLQNFVTSHANRLRELHRIQSEFPVADTSLPVLALEERGQAAPKCAAPSGVACPVFSLLEDTYLPDVFELIASDVRRGTSLAVVPDSLIELADATESEVLRTKEPLRGRWRGGFTVLLSLTPQPTAPRYGLPLLELVSHRPPLSVAFSGDGSERGVVATVTTRHGTSQARAELARSSADGSRLTAALVVDNSPVLPTMTIVRLDGRHQQVLAVVSLPESQPAPDAALLHITLRAPVALHQLEVYDVPDVSGAPRRAPSAGPSAGPSPAPGFRSPPLPLPTPWRGGTSPTP